MGRGQRRNHGIVLQLRRLDLALHTALFTPQPPRDTIFDELEQLGRLRELSLASSLVTADGLSRIVGLPLVRLDLSGCQGLDASAVPVFLQMRTLEELNAIGCTNLPESELRKLRALPRLRKCIGEYGANLR